MVIDNEKLTLSVPEAAERLGVSAATLRIAIKNGTFPMLNLGDKKWRVPVSALERYLQNAGAANAAV